MGLKIVDRPLFTATVEVATAHVQGDLVVRFVGHTTSALQAVENKATKDGRNMQDAVLAAVVDWHEPVVLPGGEVVHFTGADSLARLGDYPGILPAMLRKYYQALWEERRGNSERQPDGSMGPTTPPLPTLHELPTLPER